jgi:hypothetical protein
METISQMLARAGATGLSARSMWAVQGDPPERLRDLRRLQRDGTVIRIGGHAGKNTLYALATALVERAEQRQAEAEAAADNNRAYLTAYIATASAEELAALRRHAYDGTPTPKAEGNP